MAAGVLAHAGYFMGERFYPPDAGNPRGYFEDPQINGINEDLLAEATGRQRRGEFFAGVIYVHQLAMNIGGCVSDLEIAAKVGMPEDFAGS